MKKRQVSLPGIAASLAIAGWVYGAESNQPAARPSEPAVYPVAVLAFEERGTGVKGCADKVNDILFAALAATPGLVLVDRTDLRKTLDEHEFSMMGLVSPDQALRVGSLTGAKLLVCGSVTETDASLYLMAKIIGTETSRVLGASVKGKPSDDIGALAERLARQVAETIAREAAALVPPEIGAEDRIASLNRQLGGAKRPTVAIRVRERHVGQPPFDPAVETALTRLCRETGFEVTDPSAGVQKAEIAIDGEGLSEFALRYGNLVSVKARLEVKAVDLRGDRVIAADSQTAVAIDLTEQLAGKAALQKAAEQLAERLLPKLVP